MKKFVFLMIISGTVNFGCMGQLKYQSDGHLYFGNVTPFANYTTQWEAWGHYLSYGNKFLEIKISNAAPRIAGTTNQIVFYNSETSTFNSIQVANVYQNSDRRAKTNILPIRNGLDKVMELAPVSFNWKKGSSNPENAAQWEKAKTRGFIAQDVEQILPDAVITDENGEKLLNYSAILALLTKSVQELKQEVDSLKSEIAQDQQKGVFSNARINKMSYSNIASADSKAKLFQNMPNPFSSQASIPYYIPDNSKTASISVYDLSGKMILNKQITTRGKGRITIGSGRLSPGMYLYSLIIDNKVVDTKKMVITQ